MTTEGKINKIIDFLFPPGEENKWIHNALAIDELGEICDPKSKDAYKFDISGAMIRLFPDASERKELNDLVLMIAKKEHDIVFLYEFDMISEPFEVIELLDNVLENLREIDDMI